jgi:TetR/AcrR family transcriptional repressor of nem operon
MKVSREKAAENRETLVTAASLLFREQGIDGVGVADISKAAGLTHGALYAQFKSKQALAAEALAQGLRHAEAPLKKAADKGGLAACLDLYLSPKHRDNLAGGCAMAASASEIARQDVAVSAEFAGGLDRMAAIIEATLDRALPPKTRRQRAISITASLIGSIAASRAVAKFDPRLATEITADARHILGITGLTDLR